MILIAIPAVIIAAVSLAAFFGEWVWWLDVAANFRAQYVVVLTVLGLVLAPGKLRRIGFGVLASASINLVVILPLYLGSPGIPIAGAPSLRIMSFNLLSTNDAYKDLIEYIEVTDPDVVFLHEASRPWEVALEAADLDYTTVRARSDNLIFGTLVLVRADSPQVITYGFAEAQPRAVSIAYRPLGWPEPIEILSTHPVAPTDRKRAGLRDAQLQFATDWLAEQEGVFVVVGDFNATPWSSPFRKMLAEADVRNSQIGFGLQASFPATSNFLLRVPIDHLVHSNKLTVIDRRLGPTLGSDHFPLVVDVELTP